MGVLLLLLDGLVPLPTLRLLSHLKFAILLQSLATEAVKTSSASRVGNDLFSLAVISFPAFVELSAHVFRQLT